MGDRAEWSVRFYDRIIYDSIDDAILTKKTGACQCFYRHDRQEVKMNFTPEIYTTIPYEAAKEYVLIESCKAWAHNTMIKVSAAPMIWMIVIFLGFLLNMHFRKTYKKSDEFFIVLLLMAFVHCAYMYFTGLF